MKSNMSKRCWPLTLFFRTHCGVTCCTCLRLQCHEACIAIYSSMENQKLSHWVCISTLSMLFCLLVYTLTGASLCKATSAPLDCLQPPTTAPPLSLRRCLRLHDLWTGGRRRYSDVLSRQRRGHDHFQTAFWNIHHYHLPDYSAPGEVSASAAAAAAAVWSELCSPPWLSTRPRVGSLCISGTGPSSSTWFCALRDIGKESSRIPLRAAAESFSLWSGLASLCSPPCLCLTWVRSSASSEESAPSSSSFSLVAKSSFLSSKFFQSLEMF